MKSHFSVPLKFRAVALTFVSLFALALLGKSWWPKAVSSAQERRAELSIPGDWQPAPPMTTAHRAPASAVLNSGKVLVAGGSRDGQAFITNTDLYDPATNTWATNVQSLPVGHRWSAQLLNNGQVLVAGDDDTAAATPTSFLFNESGLGSWTKTTGNPSIKRYQTALALLPSNRVLMAGGYDNNCCTGPTNTYRSTEIYDSILQTWSTGPQMNVARFLHTATRLNDGRILVVGGAQRDPLLAYNSAEIFGESTATWTATATMGAARYAHTATRMPDGKVLVVGGLNGTAALNSVELFDPANNSWTGRAPLALGARGYHTATLLPSGKVLVAGGQTFAGVSLNSAELFDPATNTWSDAGPLFHGIRGRHVAALLPCGVVLIAGGTGANGADVATAETYQQKDALLTIGPATLPSGTAGSPYSATFTVAGSSGPYTFSTCSTLPMSLSLSSSGQLTGTSMVSGPVTLCVKVTDRNGCMTTREYRVEFACPTITISPNSLPGGSPGSNYNGAVTATGGCGTFTYSATGLPSWLTLSSNGQFSGTPPATGTYPLTVTAVVKATDKCGCMQTRTYDIVFDCPRLPLNIYNSGVGNNSLPLATGVLDAHFVMVLPDGTGATPRARDTFSGWTPPPTGSKWIGPPANVTTPGTYKYRTTFRLTGCDPASVILTGLYAADNTAFISVNGGPAQDPTPTNTGFQSPTFFSLTGFQGGVNTIDFVVTNNSFVTGLLVSFREATAKCCGCIKPFSWVTTSTGLPAAMSGMPYSASVVATGGTAPLTYTSSNMPVGLTLAANGSISGMPMFSGVRVFSVVVTDAWGCRIFRNFRIDSSCKDVTLNPPSLPNATLDAAYSQTVTATGGCGAFTYAQTAGALPPGLTLTSQGTLSGTPSTCGTYNFTIKATDKCGCMASRNYAIVVEGKQDSIPFLFNTGVNNSNALLLIGATDNHYSLSPGGPAKVLNPAANWVTSTTANWIGPAQPADNTEYVYSFMVDLRGCDLNTVNIVGRYAADNSGFIRVNGNTSQKLFTTVTTTGFQQFTSFSLNASHGLVAGKNTIAFHVSNQSLVTGLLVEIAGRAKCCPCRVAIGPDKLPGASQGFAYQTQLTATGGSGAYTYALASGHTIPPGLTLQPDGRITGTPTGCGKYVFAVTVTDSVGCIGRRVYEFEVGCRIIDFTYDFNPQVALGAPASPGTFVGGVRVNLLGDERIVAFSIGFDPLNLNVPEVTLDESLSNAELTLDMSRVGQGNLGVTISLPPGQVFPPGLQQVARVNVPVVQIHSSSLSLSFGDAPTPRRFVNAAGTALTVQTNDTLMVSAPRAVAVSAANYAGDPFTPDQIIAIFGANLATGVQSAGTIPLPTRLLGTSVTLTDGTGKLHAAPLFFVSPNQVNAQIPSDMPPGAASFTVTVGERIVAGGILRVGPVAPGVFTFDGSGRGVPAGYALRVLPDGSLVNEPIFALDQASGRLLPRPLDLGEEGERLFGVLFGTGLKGRSGLGAVEIMLGEIVVPVLYVGPQGSLVGLDQVNFEIPQTLRGRGLVDVVTTVDGRVINTVQLHIK